MAFTLNNTNLTLSYSSDYGRGADAVWLWEDGTIRPLTCKDHEKFQNRQQGRSGALKKLLHSKEDGVFLVTVTLLARLAVALRHGYNREIVTNILVGYQWRPVGMTSGGVADRVIKLLKVKDESVRGEAANAIVNIAPIGEMPVAFDAHV